MSDPQELHHIFTYKARLCEAKPGDPPMMVPKTGTNCPECKKREEAFQVQYGTWEKRQKALLTKLEAEWAEQDKKGTGS